jgi:hypothetical protein
MRKRNQSSSARTNRERTLPLIIARKLRQLQDSQGRRRNARGRGEVALLSPGAAKIVGCMWVGGAEDGQQTPGLQGGPSVVDCEPETVDYTHDSGVETVAVDLGGEGIAGLKLFKG